eukprot:1894509-Amphidinium_carterae.1
MVHAESSSGGGGLAVLLRPALRSSPQRTSPVTPTSLRMSPRLDSFRQWSCRGTPPSGLDERVVALRWAKVS